MVHGAAYGVMAKLNLIALLSAWLVTPVLTTLQDDVQACPPLPDYNRYNMLACKIIHIFWLAQGGAIIPVSMGLSNNNSINAIHKFTLNIEHLLFVSVKNPILFEWSVKIVNTSCFWFVW